MERSLVAQAQMIQSITGDPKDQHFLGRCSTGCVRSSLPTNCKCFFLLHANITVANAVSLPTAFLPGRQTEIAQPCLLPRCRFANCRPRAARCAPHSELRQVMGSLYRLLAAALQEMKGCHRAPGSPGCLQFGFSFQKLWICCLISESSEQGISVSLLH